MAATRPDGFQFPSRDPQFFPWAIAQKLDFERECRNAGRRAFNGKRWHWEFPSEEVAAAMDARRKEILRRFRERGETGARNLQAVVADQNFRARGE